MTMQNALVPGADAAQTAAPAAETQNPTGGVAPGAGGAPDAAAAPLSNGQAAPAAPSQPQFDPQQVAQWRQGAQQFNDLAGELRAFAQDQQRANEQRAAQDRAEQRQRTIYQVAQNMPPADAFTWIQDQEAQLRADLLRENQQRFEQDKRQMMQQHGAFVENLSAPLYAQELLQRNGLPVQEFAPRLQGVSPTRMAEYIPILKAEYDRSQGFVSTIANLQAQIDQLSRSGAAEQVQQSGAHISSGSNAEPIAVDNDGLPKGSNAQLAAMLRRQGSQLVR